VAARFGYYAEQSGDQCIDRIPAMTQPALVMPEHQEPPEGSIDAAVGGALTVIEPPGIDAEQDLDAMLGPALRRGS
jgi:hypothetical protein